VDGWSESAALVSFLISLKKTHNCIFIRGNHDELCYKWLTEKTYNPEWLKHGGKASIESYSKISVSEIANHLQFYDELINYHIDDQNRLFLHAGFTNLHGPKREYFSKLFYWDRTLWETALALDPTLKKTAITYPKRLLLFNEIYIGHTPVTRIETIIDANTKEFWQSDPAYTLYPDETGRN